MKLWLLLLLLLAAPSAGAETEQLIKATTDSPAELVRVDSVTAKVTGLESAIRDIERDRRYQDDRIRTLERQVEDLRRKVR